MTDNTSKTRSALSGVDMDISVESETLHRILRLANKLMTPFSVYLQAQHKISVNEFRLLMIVGRTKETSARDVALETGVSTMSVSRAVSTLQKSGRLSVERDPNNLRRKSLRLTPDGQRLFEMMRPQTRDVADFLLSGLLEDEVMSLNRFLETMITTLEAEDESGGSLFLDYTKPKGKTETTD